MEEFGLATRSLFSEIAELCESRKPLKLHRPSRARSALSDENLRYTYLALLFVDLISVDGHHYICILHNRSIISQVGQGGPLFGSLL